MAIPAEHVERRRPTDPPEDDPYIQVNIRIRRSMKERVDARRAKFGLSRDDWMRHVIEWALFQPPGTPVRPLSNGRRR